MKSHGSSNPNALEAEYLYFRLYESYLLRTPDLHKNFNMLLDLWKSHPEALSILSKNDLLRLKRVQVDVLENRYTLFNENLDLSPLVPESLKSERSGRRHQDICMELIQHKELLESFTGPIDFMNIEHPVRFGLIDVLAVCGDVAYIVEVKTDSASHMIVGQVTKYFIGLSLTLNQKWIDDIRIITLCPGYDQSSHLQLRQIGASCLVFNGETPLRIKELQIS